MYLRYNGGNKAIRGQRCSCDRYTHTTLRLGLALDGDAIVVYCALLLLYYCILELTLE
jgi:hypothetical protein